MTAVDATDSNQQRRRPPIWMTMSGAPPRPDHAAFSRTMKQMSEQKTELFTALKALQQDLHSDDSRDAHLVERKQLRARMEEIDSQRKNEESLRVGKTDEIANVRKHKNEINERLRALQSELGGFTDLKDIEEALQFVMKKMETSGGGLRSEKRTIKRLHQLEEAKALLLQRKPLTEAIEEAEEREVLLQQEYREIHERIGALSKIYEDNFKDKQMKEKEVRKTGAERTAIWNKCENIRAEITELNLKMTALREKHQAEIATWDTWCSEARAKHIAKVDAQRQERRQRYLAMQDASKIEGTILRAKRRQNTHEGQIAACETLLQYLTEKKIVVAREAETKARSEAAAVFDLTKAVPSGYTVLNEGKWCNSKVNKLMKGCKAKQEINKTCKSTSAAASSIKQSMQLHHPEDKIALFKSVDLSVPCTATDLDKCIADVRTKRKEYETSAQHEQLELYSDSDEDNSQEMNHDEHKQDVTGCESLVHVDNNQGEAKVQLVS